MSRRFHPLLESRTPTRYCPEFPAKLLILVSDTLRKSVRGHHCPERCLVRRDNSLKSRWLTLPDTPDRTLSASVRTDTPSLSREGVPPVHPTARRENIHSRKNRCSPKQRNWGQSAGIIADPQSRRRMAGRFCQLGARPCERPAASASAFGETGESRALSPRGC